jgi:anti-sigma regulatory factor (Ser/Thr protein kinase)
MAGDASTVREVRSAIRSLMEREPPELRDVAVLLTDELVSNAVIHGGGRYVLTAQMLPDCIRVEVADASSDPPQVMAPSADQERGRGMAIVDALASTWGTNGDGAGKVVWFRLDLPV